MLQYQDCLSWHWDARYKQQSCLYNGYPYNCLTGNSDTAMCLDLSLRRCLSSRLQSGVRYLYLYNARDGSQFRRPGQPQKAALHIDFKAHHGRPPPSLNPTKLVQDWANFTALSTGVTTVLCLSPRHNCMNTAAAASGS